MILQAAILLVGVSVIVSGSVCCPPVRFTAFQDVTIVNSTTNFRGNYLFVYDGVNQRYLISAGLAGAYTGTKKVIYDYKQKTGYRIDTVARTCTIFRLKGQFKDQESVCVPNGAVPLGPLFLGYGETRLNSKAYTYNSTNADGKHQNVVAVVTVRECFPVISTITTTGEGGNTLEALGYNDVRPGIRDLTVFNIPSYCTM
ncbi:ependymin-related protein 1-like [Haliotis cracherodii]|uniref:ependymin-related protein 1-like n=1 Tax=Haliotis cracherodii TaxID=6455 RepID=UPI0039EC82E3